MRIFLPLLCVLCATPALSSYDGTCLRKDPPPGVLVLSPGSALVLTCRGQVKVDGVNVRNGSNTNRRGSSSRATQTTVSSVTSAGVSTRSDRQTPSNAVSEGYHSGPYGHTDTGYTVSPVTRAVQPTGVRRLLSAEEQRDDDADYEEEEEEEEGGEGSRVTRGLKSRSWWKWTKTTVERGDQREITLEREGSSLSLPSVGLTDSGEYTCYYRGRKRSFLKVTVADPPETPSLSCHKKSPSSKIRCEWKPQKPFTTRPNCYLLYSKSSMKSFLRLKCSYSHQTSRCWCALDHSEDDLRTIHMAYLCVTSIVGNATSAPQHFVPLHIVKPDPPSQVSAQPVEGHKTMLRVTWRPPTSWKSQGGFYYLNYEMKYRPLEFSFDHEQKRSIKHDHSCIIIDAMPGVEYLIQLRAKEEYDGVWSDWSTPVYASSWTAPTSFPATTTFTDYTEGSGTDYSTTDVPESVKKTPPDEIPHHVLWIVGSFALMAVVLAVYIFRHKDRLVSKLQSLGVVTLCGDSLQPPASVPTAPEGQRLMTFGPPRYKEPPPSEVEEGEEENGEEQEEEHCANERMEAMHFNNTSYFFLQQ